MDLEFYIIKKDVIIVHVTTYLLTFVSLALYRCARTVLRHSLCISSPPEVKRQIPQILSCRRGFPLVAGGTLGLA